MINETAKTKCILNPKVAKELIRNGHKIVDIKANKDNPDKTVFVFEVTEAFDNDMSKISAASKSKSVISNGDKIVIGDKEYTVLKVTFGDEVVVKEIDNE